MAATALVAERASCCIDNKVKTFLVLSTSTFALSVPLLQLSCHQSNVSLSAPLQSLIVALPSWALALLQFVPVGVPPEWRWWEKCWGRKFISHLSQVRTSAEIQTDTDSILQTYITKEGMRQRKFSSAAASASYWPLIILLFLLLLTAVFYFFTLPSPSLLYKLYLALLPSLVLYLFPSHLQIYTLSLHLCITCPHSCAEGEKKAKEVAIRCPKTTPAAVACFQRTPLH